MDDVLPFLRSLISVSGLSGHEAPVRILVRTAWEPLTSELQVSRLGSLHGLVRGSLPEPRPSLLLSAHMDAIGLMVTEVAEGFLHVTGIGGVDPRVLPGALVTVHAREDLPGVVVLPASHLLPKSARDQAPAMEHLLVDTGLPPGEISSLVRPGDLVSFAQPPLELGSDTLAGHSLDNRASVAAITACLQQLQGLRLGWDVWAVASTQEEVGLGGATTSAFQLRPTLAVAIDVTWASSPGSPGHKTFPMGEGVVLGWGPNIHPALFREFKSLAEKLEIPYKVEIMPRHSGTDAFALQVAAEGIPTMVVSIALKYMHTPVEMVSLKDITRTGRLLAEFAASLQADFMEKLTWEEMK